MVRWLAGHSTGEGLDSKNRPSGEASRTLRPKSSASHLLAACVELPWLPFRRADPSCSSVLSLPVDPGMGLVSGALGLSLEFSYLRVFQLSFSMWFSGPSLSKEAMKRAER